MIPIPNISSPPTLDRSRGCLPPTPGGGCSVLTQQRKAGGELLSFLTDSQFPNSPSPSNRPPRPPPLAFKSLPFPPPVVAYLGLDGPMTLPSSMMQAPDWVTRNCPTPLARRKGVVAGHRCHSSLTRSGMLKVMRWHRHTHHISSAHAPTYLRSRSAKTFIYETLNNIARLINGISALLLTILPRKANISVAGNFGQHFEGHVFLSGRKGHRAQGATAMAPPCSPSVRQRCLKNHALVGASKEEDDEHKALCGLELFNTGLGYLYYKSNEDDPYIVKHNDDDDGEDDDMEIEDMTIKSTDIVIVCAHNKDEFNSLKVDECSHT